MGGSTMEEEGSSQQKKMDESEGMCRTDASNYDSCWGRICNPSRGHVLKDILRGLLVLIILAIVVTVIFLLCYFLINDIEKKEDEAIDNLVKEFSAGGESLTPEPEISIKDKNHKPLSDAEIYDSGPLRGDLGKEKDRLQKEESKQIELSSPGSNSEGENRIPEVTVFAPSSPSLGNMGENFEIVKPPFLLPEVQETTQSIPEVRIPSAEDPVVVSPHGFIPVRGSAQGNNAGLLEFNFNPEQDGQMFDNFSDFVVAESGADCVPLRLPLCSTSMPWGLTAFPNWVNNNNMNELQQSLKYFQSTIIGAKCSLRAIEYSCAILEPACGPDGIPLPPCKSFCEDISRSCSEYITSENKHSIALQCDRFPDSKNPNVCVDISKGTPSDEDYPGDSFDEVLGREDPTPAILPETTSDDEAKILEIEITDPPRDVPRIEKNGQVTSPMPREEPPKMEIVSEETVNGTTTELPVFICDHTKFLCEDGSDCLSQDAVCDGAQNCLDGSDEANCTAAPAADCTDDSFLCTTSSFCIPREWLCDGADDCRDNSDEQNCPTNSTTDFDNFADSKDGDNLVAEASDSLPGVFRVIDDDNDDELGGNTNILPGGGSSDQNVKLSSMFPISFNGNSQAEDKDASEILSHFPKFGSDSEPSYGFDNVDNSANIPPIEHFNSNAELPSVPSSETNPHEISAPETQDAPDVVERHSHIPERFKISRPNTRFSVERQESFEIRNPPQPGANVEDPHVEEPQLEATEQDEEAPIPETSTETENRGPLRRRRPGALRIPSRRLNPGNRRPINNPEETTLSADEPTTAESGPIRQNKRPSPPQYESFRTRSTPSPLGIQGKRPTSIVMRRPTGGVNQPQTVTSLADKVEDFLKDSTETQPPSAAQPITIPKQMLPQIPEGGSSDINSRRRTRIRPARPGGAIVPGRGQFNPERTREQSNVNSEPSDLAVEGSDNIEEYAYSDIESFKNNIKDENVGEDEAYPDEPQEQDYYGQEETEQQGNYYQNDNSPVNTNQQEIYNRNDQDAVNEYPYGQITRNQPKEKFPAENYRPEPASYETKYPEELTFAVAANGNVNPYNYQSSNTNNRPIIPINQRANYQNQYGNSPQNYYPNAQNEQYRPPNTDAIQEADSNDSPSYYNVRNDQAQQSYQEVPGYSQQTYQNPNGNIYQYVDPVIPRHHFRSPLNNRQSYPTTH